MELRKLYKLRIFIDESNSFGVLGVTGKGVTEYYDVDVSTKEMSYFDNHLFSNSSTNFPCIYVKTFADIHNSWLYCFTDPLELGTRVSLLHRQLWLTMRKTCPKFRRISETI